MERVMFTWAYLLLGLLYLTSVTLGVDIESGFSFAPFEQHIQSFLAREEYDGAAIGVIQNGRLIFADGFGNGADNLPIDADTPIPVSSLSKTLTAVAILKLVEDGEIELNDKVFGGEGLLSELDYSVVDDKILDITVEHLLRHSGGWDERKTPYYDPMLNKLYIARGYKIEDIEDVEKPKGLLSHYDIIRYVTKHPLDFAPGTSVRYSNFGYCLLGRIIEEVSEIPYEEYVHRHILQPVGMMHTRIGDSLGIPSLDGMDNDATVEIDSQLIHGLITPDLLDSTLGWYSSVQDIARLTINLMYPSVNQLLKPETLEIMFSRPHQEGQASDSPSWYGVGVHVRNDGAFWQESDRFDNDCIVYHIGLRGFIAASKKEDREILDQDFTFIALTMNNRFKKLKSAMERLVPLVKEWPLPIMPDKALDDLADIHIRTAKDDILIKKRLPEQHLLAYSNALRQAKFAPNWLHGYYDGETTHFVVISSKQENPDNLHFRLEISNHAIKIRNRIRHWEDVDDCKLMFVQNYISASHNGDLTHVALLNKSHEADRPQRSRPIRWGIKVKIRDYLAMLSKRTKKGYTVVAQSVSVPNEAATVDYILHRVSPNSKGRDFAAYHDLTIEQLETLAKANAANEFALAYLDTHHSAYGDEEPRFSAVFKESKKARWILQLGVKDQNLAHETQIWQARGYTPRIIVGYFKDGELNFASLWRL